MYLAEWKEVNQLEGAFPSKRFDLRPTPAE